MNDLKRALALRGDGVTIRVKVVPGASRSRVAGMLGDRLKVQVAVAPQAGKANKAVCELLAKILGIPRQRVQVVTGHTQPRKILLVAGLTLQEVCDRLTSIH